MAHTNQFWPPSPQDGGNYDYKSIRASFDPRYKQKRIRTSFKNYQINAMKRSFQMKPNPDASDLKTLGLVEKKKLKSSRTSFLKKKLTYKSIGNRTNKTCSSSLVPECKVRIQSFLEVLTLDILLRAKQRKLTTDQRKTETSSPESTVS